jgi:hypothetical protein
MLVLGTATAPAALACPPAGCGHLPGDEDPPPPNPNPPAPRYQFVIDKIDLLDLHDDDGWDEPIIKLDGQTKIANIAYPLGVHELDPLGDLFSRGQLVPVAGPEGSCTRFRG